MTDRLAGITPVPLVEGGEREGEPGPGLGVGPDRVATGIELALRLGRAAPLPGQGRTRELWELLAGLGAADLTVARVVEPHLDALAILDQAGVPAEQIPAGLLGVYAAEGPGRRLVADEIGCGGDDSGESSGWRLDGGKPWCSLVDRVGGFLVTAWVDEHERGLFLVDAGSADVTVDDSPWVARGLAEVRSPAIELRDVAAVPVGGPSWYLRRPGFAWGGIGVAAVWFGGAVGVARRVAEQASGRAPDQVALMHLGAIDAELHAARVVLAAAAEAVDSGRACGAAGFRLAARVRQVVRRTGEQVLLRADHALGPGPLTAEEEHAQRVHDLHLYLRQEHAERDQAALGRQLIEAGGRPW